MIRETHNMEMVNAVLMHPAIWPDISPEGIEPFETPYLPQVIYYLVNDGDGLICFHPFLDGMKIHANILPAKRGKLAYQAVEQSIQAIFERGYSSIYAEAPIKLKHVVRFVKQLGFRELFHVEPNIMLVRRKLDS